MAEPTDAPKDIARRNILAHIEHLRSFGEAFSQAAGAYAVRHNASESDTERQDAWIEDLSKNISEAVKVLHKSLSQSPPKVFSAFFREGEEE